MSIAPLKKVTIAGPIDQKAETLAALQDLGTMHLLPISLAETPPEKVQSREAEDARKALRFLSEVAGERREISRADDFDVR